MAAVRPLWVRRRQLLAGGQRLGCQADPLADQVAGGDGDPGRDGQPEQREESPAKPRGRPHRHAPSRPSDRLPTPTIRSRPGPRPPRGWRSSPSRPTARRARGRSAGRARFPRDALSPGAAPVKPLEDRLLLAGLESGPSSRTSMRSRPVTIVTRDVGRAVADRVLDQRVERPVEVGGRAPDRRGSIPRPPRRARRPRRQPPSCQRSSARSAASARSTSEPGCSCSPARLRTRSSSTICESRSTSDIPASSRLARGSLVRRRLADLLELQPQPGERRAQLMRGVGDEVALAAEQARHPLRHLVEASGE